MTLRDPREALADQSNFIGYLVGLARLGRVVQTLADGDHRPNPSREPDDFVHALLGLASVGAAVERLAHSVTERPDPAAAAPSDATTPARWLR